MDDLLTELEAVQARMVELNKKEQELKAAVRQKLEKQAERLKKVGVGPKATEPDRVGRILIEGNRKTADKKILEALGLAPGEVLRYPALEEARIKLEQTGLKDVSVEVVPGAPAPEFKDIRIRVREPFDR